MWIFLHDLTHWTRGVHGTPHLREVTYPHMCPLVDMQDVHLWTCIICVAMVTPVVHTPGKRLRVSSSSIDLPTNCELMWHRDTNKKQCAMMVWGAALFTAK